MAMELSNKAWKLGFQANNKRRFVSTTARDLAALEAAIASAKTKLGVIPDSRLVSCYEAGRDGLWLHRGLTAMGVENSVVDPAQNIGTGPFKPLDQNLSAYFDKPFFSLARKHDTRGASSGGLW